MVKKISKTRKAQLRNIDFETMKKLIQQYNTLMSTATTRGDWKRIDASTGDIEYLETIVKKQEKTKVE